jgi:phage terminase large subunit
MLEGRWVAAEGTVFPEFDEARHTVEPFPIPADWPLFVGYDPGYDHPTAILWIAVGPTGRYFVVDEIYQGGRSVAEHAADVKKHNREKWAGRTVHCYYGDPQHAFSITAQATKPISAQFKEAMGVGMSPWPRSQDVEAMVEGVRERLRQDRLQVFRTCENTIAEFQTWRYKRTAKGELPAGDDQYEDANNHAMDVIKGLVTMNLRYDRRGVRVIDPDKR